MSKWRALRLLGVVGEQHALSQGQPIHCEGRHNCSAGAVMTVSSAARLSEALWYLCEIGGGDCGTRGAVYVYVCGVESSYSRVVIARTPAGREASGFGDLVVKCRWAGRFEEDWGENVILLLDELSTQICTRALDQGGGKKKEERKTSQQAGSVRCTRPSKGERVWRVIFLHEVRRLPQPEKTPRLLLRYVLRRTKEVEADEETSMDC